VNVGVVLVLPESTLLINPFCGQIAIEQQVPVEAPVDNCPSAFNEKQPEFVLPSGMHAEHENGSSTAHARSLVSLPSEPILVLGALTFLALGLWTATAFLNVTTVRFFAMCTFSSVLTLNNQKLNLGSEI
jgi:hypothetical protein